MADHAIVLYDPTIDDKPEPDPTSIEANLSPEELVKREEEEKIRREKEDREKNGPHKSLKVILGLDKVVKKEDVKVPVVIDPRLTAKLRPHQVEGVKVSERGLIRSADSLSRILIYLLCAHAVFVSMYDGFDGQGCVRVYYGGRDGFG
jgi:hypothetical protein